jgi:hypothetical protein
MWKLTALANRPGTGSKNKASLTRIHAIRCHWLSGVAHQLRISGQHEKVFTTYDGKDARFNARGCKVRTLGYFQKRFRDVRSKEAEISDGSAGMDTSRAA